MKYTLQWRRSLAAWICPEMALEAKRLWRMRTDIELDRHWLAKDFPEVKAFADRALHMDSAYAGHTAAFTPWKWSADIGRFREELQSGLARD